MIFTRRTKLLCALLSHLSLTTLAQIATITVPPHHDNQKTSVTQWIGLVSVTITYHSPNVHSPSGDDRTGHIWGELVKYGLNDAGFGTAKAAPWRAGANEITTVTVSHDVKINGKNLKAGSYGVLLIVEKDKPWTWIFTKNTVSWGSYYYNQEQDVLRVEANPEDAPYTEWLTYEFENREFSSAKAFLQWENKKIGFTIQVEHPIDLYVDQMRNELTSYAGFNAMNWIKCAQFCIDNNTNLEEALTWTDIAMDGPRFHREKTFQGMTTKAQILRMLNRNDEAENLITEAVKLNPTVTELNQYGMTLLGRGENDKALKIFLLNLRNHPSEKFITHLALARAYSSMGDKKEASKNWIEVLKNVPEDQKNNLASLEAEAKK